MPLKGLYKKLLSPIFWFYLLLFSLPFTRIPYLSIFGAHVTLGTVFGIILIGTVALKSPRVFLPKNILTITLYIFLVVCAMSSTLSINPAHSLRAWIFTAFVMALALAVSSITPLLKRRGFLLTLSLSAVIASIFGYYQFFGDLSGLSSQLTGLKAAYSGKLFGFPRIQAMSLEPLYFANYLLLPISMLIGLSSKLRQSWPLLVLLITTLLLTMSRGGVGAYLVVLGLWSGYYISQRAYRRLGWAVGSTLLAAGLTVIILMQIVPALRHITANEPVKPQTSSHVLGVYTTQITTYTIGKNAENRPYTRDMALRAFIEHPVLGVGPGNYGIYLNSHNPSYPKNQTSNNEFVEILAETGILGFLSLAAFVAALIFKAVTLLRQDDSFLGTMGKGALFCLVGIGVQYYTFSTLYIIYVWVVIGLLLGTIFHLERHKNRPMMEQPE